MFTSLAGMYMAAKVHFAQIKLPFTKRKDRVVAETLYQNEVNKIEESEKYQKSKMPESGYMTVEEYEAKSRAKSKKEITEEVKEREYIKDSNMVYVPQKTFKLVKYTLACDGADTGIKMSDMPVPHIKCPTHSIKVCI